MLKLDPKKRILSDKKRIRHLTSAFFMVMFLLEVTCVALLITFATVNTYYEKYARGMRTLTIHKQDNAENHVFSEVEQKDIASIQHLTKLYPVDQRTAFEAAYIVSDDKADVELEASFIGMDKNNLPNKFHFKDSSLENVISEGAIIPDVLLDSQGTRIATRHLVGSTLRVSIDQIDFDAEIVPGEPAPRIGTEYVDLTVLGVYRTSFNPGSINEIYVSFENVGMINKIMWHGYDQGDRIYAIDVIVDDIANVDTVAEKLEKMGYQTDPVSVVMGTFIYVISIVLGLLTVLFLVIFAVIMHSIQKNMMARNGDDMRLMLTLGFAPHEILKESLALIIRQAISCFAVSVLVCIIASALLSRDVSSDVGFICGRMLWNIPLGAALTLIGELTVISCSLRSNLKEFFKSPIIIEEEK